jgi:hypothetical protein
MATNFPRREFFLGDCYCAFVARCVVNDLTSLSVYPFVLPHSSAREILVLCELLYECHCNIQLVITTDEVASNNMVQLMWSYRRHTSALKQYVQGKSSLENMQFAKEFVLSNMKQQHGRDTKPTRV